MSELRRYSGKSANNHNPPQENKQIDATQAPESTTTVEPDLPHPQTLINKILMSPHVRRIIKAESRDNHALLKHKSHKARKYAQEIAAQISYPTVRVLSRLLGWLWKRIYDGITLSNLERLHENIKDKNIIYVPCHRSHIDYLLLAYILHDQGLSIPHTAAGINLNIPIVGSILRRGGAFFLRRSFKGNQLYAAVFNAYLHEILKRGYAIEYFVEGGRSRTGRLLTPKAGMLTMTVHSYLQNPDRSIVFIPIYFGYEKLIEGDSFIRELRGTKKQKESLVSLIRSIKYLRENFGKVYVNVGDPVAIEPTLDKIKPNWCQIIDKGEERPDWISEIIDELSVRIMSGINSAAAVTPISLLATVLLSTPEQSIRELELIRQLRMNLKLLTQFKYSDSVTLPDWSPEQIILHGQKLGVIDRTTHQFDDILYISKYEALRMNYFKNNVQHLFAIPGLIASCFIHKRYQKNIELHRLVGLIYPFMKEVLCLKWDPEEINEVTTSGIEALLYLQILTRSKDGKILVRPPTDSQEKYQLLILGQSIVPILQCFFLIISLLIKNGSGVLSYRNFEQLCQQNAERLPMIDGIHSPYLFDKSLFQDFIRALFAQEILQYHNNTLLAFDENITSMKEDIQLILGEKICHNILSSISSNKKESLNS